jgi:hypothetical protein
MTEQYARETKEIREDIAAIRNSLRKIERDVKELVPADRQKWEIPANPKEKEELAGQVRSSDWVLLFIKDAKRDARWADPLIGMAETQKTPVLLIVDMGVTLTGTLVGKPFILNNRQPKETAAHISHIVSRIIEPPHVKGKLERFMYELLYPGVLGAGIVAVAVRFFYPQPPFSSRPWDESFWLGTLLLLFFSTSFLIDSRRQYRPFAFVLDLIEVGGMFAGFHLLKLLVPPANILERVNVPAVYLVLAALIALQVLWRNANGLSWSEWWWARLVAGVVLFLGWFFHDGGLFFHDRWPHAVNDGVVAVLAVLILLYDICHPD